MKRGRQHRPWWSYPARVASRRCLGLSTRRFLGPAPACAILPIDQFHAEAIFVVDFMFPELARAVRSHGALARYWRSLLIGDELVRQCAAAGMPTCTQPEVAARTAAVRAALMRGVRV